MKLKKRYDHGYSFYNIIKYYCQNPYSNFNYNLYVNKYLVKNAVKDIINVAELYHHITNIKQFDEINFDIFPDKFIVKGTHGSGDQLIVDNKNEMDKYEIRKFCESTLNYNHGYIGPNKWDLPYIWEKHYNFIEKGIIFEEYLGNVVDYQFHVIQGKPESIWTCQYDDVYIHNSYNMNWNYISDHVWLCELDDTQRWKILFNPNIYPNCYTDVNHSSGKKPENFKEMVDTVYKLVGLFEEVPYIRVDLYNINNVLYFGEFTPTSQAGNVFNETSDFIPEWDTYFGSLINFQPDIEALEKVKRHFN